MLYNNVNNVSSSFLMQTDEKESSLILWMTDSQYKPWYVCLTWSTLGWVTQADKHMWSGLLKYIPQKKGATGSLIRGVNVYPNNGLSSVACK